MTRPTRTRSLTFRGASVFGVLRESKGLLAQSAVLALVQALLLIGAGLLVRRAFDHEIPGHDVGGLLETVALMVGLVIVAGAISVATRHLVLRATKSSVGRLRTEVMNRLHALPLGWFHTTDSRALHATVVQETERLDTLSASLGAQLIPATVITAGVFVALAVVSPVLFGVVIVTAPLAVAASLIGRREMRRRMRLYQQAFDRYSKRVLFTVSAPSLIRTDAVQASELATTVRAIGDVSEAGRRAGWLQYAMAQSGSTVATLIGAVTLVVGGARVANGDMSLGALLGFYALLLPLRAQFTVISVALPALVVGQESVRRLNAILEDPAHEPYDGTLALNFEGALELRDVHFGYSPDDPVLRGVSLSVEPGSIVGLTGPNGAGKSTIAALALGLFKPWAGRVLVDGRPLETIDIARFRAQVSVVPQRPVILRGTVAENIAFGDPQADRSRILDAAEQATADVFVRTMPAGLDTLVGDDGELVSGGQAQRIAVARALLRRPALLILDEPTASMDAGSAQALLERLQTLPWKPAILLISHDRASLAVADRLCVLEDGHISQAPILVAESARQ